MADNTQLPIGTLDGDVYASDDIGGVKFQRVKIIHGADGVNAGDVATGNPLPVDTELPAAAALADGAANPTTPSVGANNLVYNGTTWDRARGDTANGLDVDVTRLPALVAGTANIGDVDVLTVPAPLSTTGNGTAAAALRVTLASDSTGTIAVTQATAANLNAEVQGDAANDAPVTGNPVLMGGRASAAAPTDVSTDGDAVSAWRLRNGAAATVITAAGALVGGDATNGLDVDVTRLPALVAGTANIGDVDVLTVPAPLSTSGNGTAATALRVTVASDSTGIIAATCSQATASNLNAEVQGDAAHDAAVSGNPVLVGMEARSSLPTAVASGDAVRAQADLDGRLIVEAHSPRELIDENNITLTSTTETTLLTAVASIFLDLTLLVLSNTSATLVRVDIRDSTTGTVRLSVALAANGGGAVIQFPCPKKQGTVNNNWTAQLSGAVTDVRIFAQAVRRH